jgi:hypothetical protein
MTNTGLQNKHIATGIRIDDIDANTAVLQQPDLTYMKIKGEDTRLILDHLILLTNRC